MGCYQTICVIIGRFKSCERQRESGMERDRERGKHKIIGQSPCMQKLDSSILIINIEVMMGPRNPPPTHTVVPKFSTNENIL